MGNSIMEAEATKHCVNCGQEVSNNYCSNCGQRNNMPRYTLGILIDNFLSNIFSFERGFWLTLKTLIISPNTVIESYLEGNTVRYFHPMKLFIFFGFINTFLILQLGIFDQSLDGFQGVQQPDAGNPELQLKTMEYIKKYMNVINLINIPFYALSSFLLYRKKKLNYAEHAIINTYALSTYVGLSILFSVAFFFVPKLIGHYSVILVLLSWVIYVYTFHSFFRDSWIKTIVKTILITFMSMFFISIVVVILVFVLALVFNPDVLSH